MLRKLEYQPCIPTRGTEVPSGPDWFHEIKHDGYRLIVQREGKRVRLLTRRGYDWSDRHPLITQAALSSAKTHSCSTGSRCAAADAPWAFRLHLDNQRLPKGFVRLKRGVYPLRLVRPLQIAHLRRLPPHVAAKLGRVFVESAV